MRNINTIKLTFAFLIIVIFISGCTGSFGKKPEDTSSERIYIGTKGLDMKFSTNLPPARIYDKSDLTIIAELENQGIYDLTGSNCMVHLSGYDKNIIRGIDNNKYCGDGLWSKTITIPEGGRDTVEFSSDRISLPEGIDSLQQNFVLTACYEYETIANPIICINPNLYKISAIQDACIVSDVGMAGGQGAPVAVNRVEVDMIGEDTVNYVIHISNVGSGTVLRPGISVTGRTAHSCPFNLDDYDDFNVIDYSVSMSGGSMIKCSPDKIRLTNNQARLFCRFRVAGDSAYTTPLKINLIYNYMDSISKKVELIKTPE